MVYLGHTAYFFLLMVTLCGGWDLKFPDQDQTCVPRSGIMDGFSWTTGEVPYGLL